VYICLNLCFMLSPHFLLLFFSTKRPALCKGECNSLSFLSAVLENSFQENEAREKNLEVKNTIPTKR
jgi:hypothetical protein